MRSAEIRPTSVVMASRRLRWRQQCGFSLVETIAALVVMAAAVLLLSEAGGSGWRGIRHADDIDGATLLARSLLASVGNERPLVTGRATGAEADGLLWSIDIEQQESPAPMPSRISVSAFRVVVTVTLPDALSRSVSNIRLATVLLGGRS